MGESNFSMDRYDELGDFDEFIRQEEARSAQLQQQILSIKYPCDMEKKDRYEALKLENAAMADKVKALQSDNIDRDESSGLGSSTMSRHRVADGKKQITDADGRAYRVYNKIKGAEAIRANLHTVRLTDPFRLDVLLGEERIQLVPSVWLSILEKKCTEDFFGFYVW